MVRDETGRSNSPLLFTASRLAQKKQAGITSCHRRHPLFSSFRGRRRRGTFVNVLVGQADNAGDG
jgi:hypothetical protein